MEPGLRDSIGDKLLWEVNESLGVSNCEPRSIHVGLISLFWCLWVFVGPLALLYYVFSPSFLDVSTFYTKILLLIVSENVVALNQF